MKKSYEIQKLPNKTNLGFFGSNSLMTLMKHAQICFVGEISEFHNFSSIGRERLNKSNRFLAEPFSGEFHFFS